MYRGRKENLGPIFEEFHRVLNAPHGRSSRDYFRRTDAVIKAAWGIADHSFQIAWEPSAMRAVVEAIRGVRMVKGPGCTYAEDILMRAIKTMAQCIHSGLQDSGISMSQMDLSNLPEMEPVTRTAYEGLQVIHDCGLESLHYRRSQDSFGVKRRVLALALFQTISPWMVLDEPLHIATRMMHSGKPKERTAAIELLKACPCNGVTPKYLTFGGSQ